MKKPRQVQLAKIFDPNGGDLSAFVSAFIAYVEQNDRFIRSVFRRKVSSWPSFNKLEQYPQRDIRLFGRFDDNLPYRLSRGIKPKYRSEYDFGLNVELGTILHQIKNSFFANGEHKGFHIRETKISDGSAKKLSSSQFSKVARQLFEDAYVFLDDPQQVINDTIVTMRICMRWASIFSQNPEELLAYMGKMLEPSIYDEKRQRLISPLDLLGYANNGVIAIMIDGDIPFFINDEPIFAHPSSNEPFLNPKFVELWLSQDLEIGGCPALVRRRQTAIYNDFAEMWMRCAKILADKKTEVTMQRKVSNDSPIKFAAE